MSDTCAYCGLGIIPAPEAATGYRHAYQESEGHDAGPDIDPEYPPTSADLDPAIARLTRERDAALAALKQASDIMKERGNDLFDLHMEESKSDLRPSYRSLWEAARAAARTIKDIETGAIHNDQ